VPSTPASADMPAQFKVGIGIGCAVVLVLVAVIGALVFKLRAAGAARRTKLGEREGGGGGGSRTDLTLETPEMDGAGRCIEQVPDNALYELAGHGRAEVEGDAARRGWELK
jgi:hypothetical protein